MRVVFEHFEVNLNLHFITVMSSFSCNFSYNSFGRFRNLYTHVYMYIVALSHTYIRPPPPTQTNTRTR